MICLIWAFMPFADIVKTGKGYFFAPECELAPTKTAPCRAKNCVEDRHWPFLTMCRAKRAIKLA